MYDSEMIFALVHLGSKLPNHLIANCRYLEANFSEISTTVVVDNVKNCKKLSKNGINYYLVDSDQLDNDRLLKGHYSNFRNGFWRLTVERFLALEDFHKKHPEAGLLHIENDVLLLPEFSPSDFSQTSKINWLSYTEDSDSAAIFYSPTYSQTLTFSVKLKEILNNNPGITDMRALNEIRKVHPEDYEVLPSLENEQVLGNEGITKSKIGSKIYDPALLGMWLFGEDPMNHFGVTREHFIRGENTHLPFDLITKKNMLILKQGTREFSVANLHLHVKDKRYFSVNWTVLAIRSIYDASSGRHRRKYFPKVTLRVLGDYRRRGKLHSLLLLIPPVRKINNARKNATSW